MSILHTLWPMAFRIEKGNVGSFVVRLIVFGAVCAVVNWFIGLLSGIFLIGVLFGLLGSLLELYSLAGILLCILVFAGILS